MGEEAQRDRGLEQCTNINMQQRERPSEPGQSWWVHTTELQQHGRSGILTLAFSANCYSFTPALFPKTLNLQSLRVRCGYYISQHALGRLGASHEYRPQLLTLTYFEIYSSKHEFVWRKVWPGSDRFKKICRITKEVLLFIVVSLRDGYFITLSTLYMQQKVKPLSKLFGQGHI